MKKRIFSLLMFPLLMWGRSQFWDENFHPLEQKFWQNRANSNLIEGILITAWLTNQESVSFYASQWQNTIADLARNQYASDAEKAEKLLLTLHERFLKRYRETANTVSGIFQTGEFNCASASLLYAISAHTLGIPVRLNLYTRHARPEVFVGGQWIEVEATSPLGYNFRQKPQVQQDFVRVTSFANEKVPLVVLTNTTQWYAMWYANEVYFQVQRRSFSNAFQLALRALELDKQIPLVQTNAIGAYQEYASFLVGRRLTNEALAVLEEGITQFPENRVLSNNYRVTIYQMTLDTLKAGQLAEGRRLLEQYLSVLLGDENMVGAAYQELLYRLIQTNAYQEAWETLQNVKSRFLERSWYTKVSAYGMTSLVKKLVSEWKLYPLYEDLVLKWYEDLRIPERESYLLEYYNNLGMAYKDAGFLQKTEEIWKKGLSYLPRASILQKNLASLYIMKASDTTSLKEKLSFYKQALAYDPENWEIDRAILITYRNLAEEYSNREDWKSVLQITEEALLAYPNDKQLQYYRDYAKRKLGK
ncbi:transglutaminase domain-containing protein [Thermospira aquatica]|uniref:Transglutaminase domain-containing protein n=1 Tax=Thermospira aquatica TaxID=2828656 RepID=A0AAX3BC41_9SPIR|nr:transglutaminase domain-containing protein [Thermospira aquatica]URA09883.1 transglutaminase domain-containing protein [Thermospira aquatica]